MKILNNEKVSAIKNRLYNSKRYFLLGHSYIEISKLAIESIIDSGNPNYIISDIPIYESDLILALKHNDTYLLRPALFSFLQALELYMKGLLILKNKFNNEKKTHDIDLLLKYLERNYNENEEVLLIIKQIIEKPNLLLSTYMRENSISNFSEMYESFRYPETKKAKIFNYDDLLNNGSDGISELKHILSLLEKLHISCLKYYRENEDVLI